MEYSIYLLIWYDIGKFVTLLWLRRKRKTEITTKVHNMVADVEIKTNA
jgi:hypothetical protein